jgi:hypothetical protein
MSDEPDEVAEEEDGDEEESAALRAERVSKELSNETSPTGPPAEPIAEGDQPAQVQDYRSP